MEENGAGEKHEGAVVVTMPGTNSTIYSSMQDHSHSECTQGTDPVGGDVNKCPE